MLGLLLGVVVLFGFRLGSYPLVNPDEGRYAQIPREMVATGDWVTPRLNGLKYFEKPPLVYWAVAVCHVAFGSNEWSMRFTPAFFGLAGVMLTSLAGVKLYGRLAGLLAGMVLATSMLYFGLARVLILDMPMAVLMSATLFCFILGIREPVGLARQGWFYGLYASAALATLTKGFMGFLVTGAVMFLWLLIFNQWRRLRPLYLPTGLALFLVIAVPWHWLAAQANPDWAQFYFVHEHWTRFFTQVHGRYEPWWFFVPVLGLGLFPWIGFLWPAARAALRGGWAARKENAAAWFLVTWAVFIFLFFSKSQSKLIPYILPIFPPLAVLIGAWLATTLQSPAGARLRTGLTVFSFVCGLLAVGLLTVVAKPELIRVEEQALAVRWPAVVMAIVLITGGVVAPALARARRGRAALGAVALTMVGFFATLSVAAPDVLRPSTQPLALMLKARAQPEDRVYCYRHYFHDFVFYAGRFAGTVAFEGELEFGIRAEKPSDLYIDIPAFRAVWSEPGRVFAVARKRDVTELFADPDFRYHLLGETRGHCLFSNQP